MNRWLMEEFIPPDRWIDSDHDIRSEHIVSHLTNQPPDRWAIDSVELVKGKTQVVVSKVTDQSHKRRFTQL